MISFGPYHHPGEARSINSILNMKKARGDVGSLTRVLARERQSWASHPGNPLQVWVLCMPLSFSLVRELVLLVAAGETADADSK